MKNTKRGFTIVELVIVIAVIAILAAILIPVFSNVIDTANKSSLKAEIKNSYSKFVADAALENETYAAIEDYIYQEVVEEGTGKIYDFEGEITTIPANYELKESDVNGFDIYGAKAA